MRGNRFDYLNSRCEQEKKAANLIIIYTGLDLNLLNYVQWNESVLIFVFAILAHTQHSLLLIMLSPQFNYNIQIKHIVKSESKINLTIMIFRNSGEKIFLVIQLMIGYRMLRIGLIWLMSQIKLIIKYFYKTFVTYFFRIIFYPLKEIFNTIFSPFQCKIIDMKHILGIVYNLVNWQ